MVRVSVTGIEPFDGDLTIADGALR